MLVLHGPSTHWSVRVAERLALPTSDHGVVGSNPAGGEILPEPKRHFIAQSLSCSPFHRLEMTEILLKGRKTLTHPSILRHVSGHFGRGQLAYKHCSWVSLLRSLPVLSAHSFASNWQLPFLNQRKGENGRKNYFITKLHERMLPDVRIEPATVRIPGGRASDRATAPGPVLLISVIILKEQSNCLTRLRRHWVSGDQKI